MSASPARRPDLPFRRNSPSEILGLFMPPAIAMLAAAGLALLASFVTDGSDLRWLALHLALLGGVSQLIVGVGQFFVCSYLATTPPPARLLRAQLIAWNVGAVLVAIGVVAGPTALAEFGVVFVLAGIALLAVGINTMRKSSLQTARWAIQWYLAAAAFLAAGAVVGGLLAHGVAWTHGSLLGTHVALNIGGWIGAAIVGTLHTFFPTLTGTRLAFPRLQPPTFYLWTIGFALLAVAAAVDSTALAAVGLAFACVAGAMLASNLVTAMARRVMPLTKAAALVTAGQCLLPFALLTALILVLSGGAALESGSSGRVLLAVLALGWVGLTVAGSLVHLLHVLRHVRRLRAPNPRP